MPPPARLLIAALIAASPGCGDSTSSARSGDQNTDPAGGGSQTSGGMDGGDNDPLDANRAPAREGGATPDATAAGAQQGSGGSGGAQASDAQATGDGQAAADSQAGADGSPAGGTGGCTVLPPDNAWNTDISSYAVHPNSDNYIASIGADENLHPDFGTVWEGAPIGIPFVRVDASTPRREVSFMYPDESEPGPYPIPDDPPIEGGPQGTGDRHILMVDLDACRLYELFDAWPPGQGHNPSSDRWYAGSGAIFDLRSNALRPDYWTSADAAGLPIYPGLVRYDEVVETGEIEHALRFTVAQSQRAFIHPATHFASDSTNPDHPPMGLRLRLKADYDISGFSTEVQVILRALKTYGMFVADNGSDWFVSGAPNPQWDDDRLRDLKDVPGGAFEAVDTGPLIY